VNARLEALRREQPSYAPWLSLVEIALSSAAEPAWDAAAAVLAPSPEGDVQAVTGVITSDAVVRLAARLLAAAPADPTDMLRATIEELAALPLLQACRRRFSDRAQGWTQGHCPICGAWPTLAELRGLDRARRLRCGRCGADWGLAPLRCPFCENDDHEKQRSLVPEKGGESRRVDVCDVCQGYLKALAQHGAIRPEQVALEDLASVELDLAAIDRGYHRPDPRPEAVRVEVA
jgi:FdhE protein